MQIPTRKCSDCREIKSADQFHRNQSEPKLGLSYICKDCQRNRAHTNREKVMSDPQKAARLRERHRLEARRARTEGRARTQVYNYVVTAKRNGSLIRQPCSICGTKPAQAHHEDYAKPLQVTWLCSTHHAQHHTLMSDKEQKPQTGKEPY